MPNKNIRKKKVSAFEQEFQAEAVGTRKITRKRKFAENKRNNPNYSQFGRSKGKIEAPSLGIFTLSFQSTILIQFHGLFWNITTKLKIPLSLSLFQSNQNAGLD